MWKGSTARDNFEQLRAFAQVHKMRNNCVRTGSDGLFHTSSCLRHLDFLKVKVPNTAPHYEGRVVDMWTCNTLQCFTTHTCVTHGRRGISHRSKSVCIAGCVPEVPIDPPLRSLPHSVERGYRRSSPVVQVSEYILHEPNSATEA